VTEGWTALVLRRGTETPDAAAVVTAEESWTWSDLLRRSGGAAELLAAAGLAPGQPVPGLVDHAGVALALTIAGSSAGTPFAPLGTRLTVAELTAITSRLGSPVLLAQREHAALADQVAAGAGVRAVVVESLPDGPIPAAPSIDGVVVVLHTSGTTGLPKTVTVTERALLARMRTSGALVTLGPGDTYLPTAAFHHVSGFGNCAVTLGAGATVASFPRYTAEGWKALRPRNLTHTLIIPSMIVDLLDKGALDVHPNLRLMAYGAAPIRPDVLMQIMETLPNTRLLQLYGQTEGTPMTALTPEDHDLARAGRTDLLRSVGRAAPGVTLRIDKPDADGIGEVWGQGEHFSDSAIAADGWLHTGDLGRLDEDGYVFLEGRTGDTINRGGENVRPLEVEDVLRTHPAVKELAVVGLPDRRLGEQVAAFVIPRDPSVPLDEADLRAHTRASLAGFKVPERWFVVSELPRNAGGKVLRRVLAASVVEQVVEQENS
jgi:acyl-CoA synthetase (AMP-forming)/AMP-acid ligase II